MKHMHKNDPLKKVTINLPTSLINKTLARNDKTLSEAIREALRAYNHARACDALRALRGKVKFQYTWQELRAMDDE